MTDRPTFVYMLAIEYPMGIDWRNPPENWEPIFIPPDDETSFQWPPERRFLSKRAAEHRAERLRSYGCTVEVRRSQPVVW
jgi:hypothetical protein